MNKITLEWIKDKIVKVDYLVLPGTTCTICNLILENGFSVRGESSCVDPANFSAEMGREIAYDAAVDKVWLLEGYLLAEGLWTQKGFPDFGWALNQLRAGHKVTRKGWNGKGMWLGLHRESGEFVREECGTSLTYRDYIVMKTVDNQLVPWVASQTDMLASDWELVP